MPASSPPTSKGAQRTARADQLKRQMRRRLWLVGGGSVALLAVVAVLLLIGGGSTRSTANQAGTAPQKASVHLLEQVTSVPAGTLSSVGLGRVRTRPVPLADAPALVADGKPRVVSIGADYCPFCAAQRWALVQALSRFGTFDNLSTVTSSAVDVYPSTATFSFHGAVYRSDYLSFTGLELATSTISGGHYTTLDTPSAADQALLDTYDAPPYAAQAGGIPFLDLGGKFLLIGATYDPGVLAGKTADQIAAALADPADPIAQAVDGSANLLTADLCQLTGGRPQAVCAAAPVRAAAAS
jgi:Domain of unknown function (DUF929)